jgi:release factor glutamine methyltransferase
LADVVVRLRSAGCVFAEDEAQLLISAAGSPSQLAELLERRAAGQPLEHIVGWAEFCGLRIAVDRFVFVPRRRTEFLVAQAIALAGSSSVVVDLCCGSGAVGAALCAAMHPLEVYATDIDPAAVRCARRNIAATDSQVFEVYEGDLYEPLPDSIRGRVDILAVNAPYVPSGAIRLLPYEAREFEAPVALDGGVDGLDILRRVIAEAPRWLAPGGALLIETSERQARHAMQSMARAGLISRVATSPELEATIVIGTRPASQDGRGG